MLPIRWAHFISQLLVEGILNVLLFAWCYPTDVAPAFLIQPFLVR